jgi:hypothetical protein
MGCETLREDSITKNVSWVTDEIVFKTSVKEIEKMQYIFQGKRLKNDGEIVILKNDAAERAQGMLITKIQNKIKTRIPINATIWQNSLNLIINKIKEFNTAE